MKLTFDIPGIPKVQEEHWHGILLSFFQSLEDVLAKRRKGSYILHFYLERLDKGERKTFLLILAKIISSMAKTKKNNHVSVTGSTGDLKMSEKFQKVFTSMFESVSKPTTVSHQAPKARTTLIKKSGKV